MARAKGVDAEALVFSFVAGAAKLQRAFSTAGPSPHTLGGARIPLKIDRRACHTREMAIEDYMPKTGVRRTGHAPSRVRTMLQRLRGQLHVETPSQRSYSFFGGRTAVGTQLVQEIDEALAEWIRLDDLILRERMQRQRIDARISSFVRFYVGVRWQLREAEDRPRRPMTAAQKVIAAARLRATRKARGTMGKRQKKRIKGQ